MRHPGCDRFLIEPGVILFYAFISISDGVYWYDQCLIVILLNNDKNSKIDKYQ